MGFMPFQIVGVWVRGLLVLGFLLLGPYLLYKWYESSLTQVSRPVAQFPAAATRPDIATAPGLRAPHPDRVFSPSWGFNKQTSLFAIGIGMILWALPKGPALNLRRLRLKPGTDEPKTLRIGESQTVKRPDGSELCVEIYGPRDGMPIVFTHGWGLDSEEWYYIKKELSQCRLIVWDLPGVGLSTQSKNRDFSLDNMARDLEAVITAFGDGPVVLLGHSIGGMICLTHHKLFPESMGNRIAGLIIVNSTYTNPVKTTSMAGLKSMLQKPLFEPLLHLTIWLSPFVRLMNWFSYMNGSAHSSAERSGFTGGATRGQLDFVARYTPRVSPAVIARGMLGMLRYDASETLSRITVPSLIITGDQDAICKPEASEHMRASIRHSKLTTLSPAKHQGLIEHHEEFGKAVVDFVGHCYAVRATTIEVGIDSSSPTRHSPE